MREKTDVLGVGFDNITKMQAIEEALRLIEERRAAYVVTPNPEIVMLCRENGAACAAVNGADLVLPDGIGVVKAAAMLKTPLKERVPGIDFASGLIATLAEKGGSVFLFGAKPQVAEKAAENLLMLYPGLKIAGTQNGYFEDDGGIKDKINAAAPDFLLVCLGAPKQELWMQENAGKLNVGIMAGLGGVLDVYSGNVERAPEFWQKMGLEWFYRLLKDPKRIGRTMQLPKFLIEVKKQNRG